MSQPVLVMKFGGTSVGSPEAIARAARLIREQARRRRVAVVASAMSQVTNRLLATLDAGARGDSATVEANLARLRDKHFAACSDLLPPERQAAVRARMAAILQDFGRIAKGMLLLRERPPRSVDEAAPTGELLAARLVSEVLCAEGVESVAVSGADVIVTDAVFGSAAPFLDETATKAEEALRPLLDAGKVPVVTGYNGSTRDGVPTTLGRGGSDYSAAIVAAALGADALWIWTDVDGILSGDPRIAPDARLLSEVTYNEAAELAFNGAKVLHPRTLAPLAEMGIPVRIKNSFRPDRSGTRISGQVGGREGVRAVTSLSDVVLISIEAANSTLSGAQLMSRALAAAARAKVEVLLLTRSSFRQNFCMLVHGGDVETVLESLRGELALELAHGYLRPIGVDRSVGLLAAVGEGMRGTPGLAGRLFTAISKENVNIIAIAQGSSELTIAIVVNQNDLRTAVSAIHSECGLGRRTERAIA
ncbi:MAG: aspartate kinase [Bryobacterales bacterium]|nr:aspartate kinase [Bryobacterales bacterium]MDE0627052.1 aspartate kinase [Bryobacterales bacterium]